MKKYAVVGIVFLFIISSVTPMVIGYNTEIKDIDSELEAELANLQYLCTYPDGFNDVKFEYYKEHLVNDYSDDDLDVVEVVEPVDVVVQEDLPLPLDGPMDSPWPMKCYDTHHTGLSPYSTADNPLEEIWKFRCDMIEGGPVIGENGTLYFGDMGSHGSDLYAVNPDGTEKWRYKTGMWIWSAPAIDEDGTVYVGSFDSWLYAINPDGTEKWSIGTGGNVAGSPAIAEDGTIYVGVMGPGDYGRINAVNPNGTIKWIYNTGYWITSDAAIADDGTVYIGSGDDYLYAINPNGTLKWRFKTRMVPFIVVVHICMR
jgi:outer membrane protein assembly factor BamB